MTKRERCHHVVIYWPQCPCRTPACTAPSPAPQHWTPALRERLQLQPEQGCLSSNKKRRKKGATRQERRRETKRRGKARRGKIKHDFAGVLAGVYQKLLVVRVPHGEAYCGVLWVHWHGCEHGGIPARGRVAASRWTIGGQRHAAAGRSFHAGPVHPFPVDKVVANLGIAHAQDAVHRCQARAACSSSVQWQCAVAVCSGGMQRQHPCWRVHDTWSIRMANPCQTGAYR